MRSSLFSIATGSTGQKKPAQKLPPSLADHFADCARMGRYLTMMDSGRFVISDDFTSQHLPSDATALASICSRDEVVARAALLPLGMRVVADGRRQGIYEELFGLIEQQALSPRVRAEAEEIMAAGFREKRIRELEASLHDELNPARSRYRAFLETVSQLIHSKISQGYFLDEFIDFTNQVAGRLDFGIYSFCLDRIFSTPQIPLKLKKTLVVELMRFPPLIRRELLSNILINPGAAPELHAFVRHATAMHLKKERVLEIELLEALKLQRLSTSDIELSLRGRAGIQRPGMA